MLWALGPCNSLKWLVEKEDLKNKKQNLLKARKCSWLVFLSVTNKDEAMWIFSSEGWGLVLPKAKQGYCGPEVSFMAWCCHRAKGLL